MRVVVDTYALLAMVFDELSVRAREVLLAIRRGGVEGVVTNLVVYEFALHWQRGRVPALKTVDELLTFFNTYFKIVDLSYRDLVEVAIVKSRGDEILGKCEDPSLRSRRLSITDASLIYIAKKLELPILTGDRDLTYVARAMGVKVIW